MPALAPLAAEVCQPNDPRHRVASIDAGPMTVRPALNRLGLILRAAYAGCGQFPYVRVDEAVEQVDPTQQDLA